MAQYSILWEGLRTSMSESSKRLLSKINDLCIHLTSNRQTGNTAALMNALLSNEKAKLFVHNYRMMEMLSKKWRVDKSRFLNIEQLNNLRGLGSVAILFDGQVLEKLFIEISNELSKLIKENDEMKENTGGCCSCTCGKSNNQKEEVRRPHVSAETNSNKQKKTDSNQKDLIDELEENIVRLMDDFVDLFVDVADAVENALKNRRDNTKK